MCCRLTYCSSYRVFQNRCFLSLLCIIVAIRDTLLSAVIFSLFDIFPSYHNQLMEIGLLDKSFINFFVWGRFSKFFFPWKLCSCRKSRVAISFARVFSKVSNAALLWTPILTYFGFLFPSTNFSTSAVMGLFSVKMFWKLWAERPRSLAFLKFRGLWRRAAESNWDCSILNSLSCTTGSWEFLWIGVGGWGRERYLENSVQRAVLCSVVLRNICFGKNWVCPVLSLRLRLIKSLKAEKLEQKSSEFHWNFVTETFEWTRPNLNHICEIIFVNNW